MRLFLTIRLKRCNRLSARLSSISSFFFCVVLFCFVFSLLLKQREKLRVICTANCVTFHLFFFFLFCLLFLEWKRESMYTALFFCFFFFLMSRLISLMVTLLEREMKKKKEKKKRAELADRRITASSKQELCDIQVLRQMEPLLKTNSCNLFFLFFCLQRFSSSFCVPGRYMLLFAVICTPTETPAYWTHTHTHKLAAFSIVFLFLSIRPVLFFFFSSSSSMYTLFLLSSYVIIPLVARGHEKLNV